MWTSCTQSIQSTPLYIGVDGLDRWTKEVDYRGRGKPTARGAYIYPPGLDPLDSTPHRP